MKFIVEMMKVTGEGERKSGERINGVTESGKWED